MSKSQVSNSWTTKRLAYLALLIALSAVGANLKIPSITGTPAFDSFPGFLAALILGPADGALVASLGHLLTALTSGFPLTIPVHLGIAVGMAGIVALFALISRYTLWGGIAAGVVLNGIAFPALFIPFPGFGLPFFLGMVVPLLIASALNIALAEMAFRALHKAFPQSYAKSLRGGVSR